MASYVELLELAQDETLRQRILVAVYVAAGKIRSESTDTPHHTERLNWARRVFELPITDLTRMQWVVLVTNRALTKAQLLAATDDQVQSAVDGAVNLFAVT